MILVNRKSAQSLKVPLKGKPKEVATGTSRTSHPVCVGGSQTAKFNGSCREHVIFPCIVEKE